MATIGDLSIITSDGVTLSASNDLSLAWKWAEHKVNVSPELPAWDDISYKDQCGYAAAALASLRHTLGE